MIFIIIDYAATNNNPKKLFVTLREKCPYSELFWSKSKKMRTRITRNTDTFYAVQRLMYREI